MAAGSEECGSPEHVFRLPDGVASRLKYDIDGGSARAQFRVPNRDIEDHPGLSVDVCARRVVAKFVRPHQTLELDSGTRGAFLAYQTLLSIRANAAAKARMHKQRV